MSQSNGPIKRSDIEDALRGFVNEGQDTVADVGTKAAGVAGAIAFLALAVTYVLGRRRGRKARSVVEVRRI